MTAVMDRDDVLDLLAIIASTDRRTVGEGELETWMQLIANLPKDDCLDAILAHRKEQPGVWLEPGHIVQRVKAIHRDRYDLADPETRDNPWSELGGQPALPGVDDYADPVGVRRDRSGHVDKSAPEPLALPLPCEHPPGIECIAPGCRKASTFGDWCAKHYVLAGAWSKNGPTAVPAASLAELFERTADEML